MFLPSILIKATSLNILNLSIIIYAGNKMANRFEVNPKPNVSSKEKKLQAASEYLMIYIWAILTIVIIIILFRLLVLAPSSIVPSSCSFSYGAYCQDLIMGSNALASKVVILLTNTQQYPIINPQLVINASNVGIMTGTCYPNFVLPGGAIICNATVSQKAISLGTLVSGKMYLSAIPCPSGNASSCSTNTRQTYIGNFNTHTSQLLSATTVTISISVLNSTQAANNVPDPVTATVKLLGYPISGATVNFTATNITTGAKLQYISLKPSIATTNSNGNVTSFVSTSTPGFAKITASFAGVSKSVIINFSTPIYVTFTTNQTISINQPILVIDGINYLPSQLPITFAWTKNSKHNYNFLDVQSTNTERDIFSSVSGCNLANKAGQIIATSNCTAVGNYKKQYFLSTSVNPPQAGSVTPSPPGNWYDSGSSVEIAAYVTGSHSFSGGVGTGKGSYTGSSVGIPAYARGGYSFLGWVGTGSGSYTGANAEATVVMNSPITEQANFYSPTFKSITTTIPLHFGSSNYKFQCPPVGSLSWYIGPGCNGGQPWGLYECPIVYTGTFTSTLSGKTYTICDACIAAGCTATPFNFT